MQRPEQCKEEWLCLKVFPQLSRHVYFCISFKWNGAFLLIERQSHTPFGGIIMGPYLWKNKLVNGESAMDYTYDVC